MDIFVSMENASINAPILGVKLDTFVLKVNAYSNAVMILNVMQIRFV
jgi:hypothetical protein